MHTCFVWLLITKALEMATYKITHLQNSHFPAQNDPATTGFHSAKVQNEDTIFLIPVFFTMTDRVSSPIKKGDHLLCLQNKKSTLTDKLPYRKQSSCSCLNLRRPLKKDTV